MFMNGTVWSFFLTLAAVCLGTIAGGYLLIEMERFRNWMQNRKRRKR